jgi:aspartyl-tRNA(Asn)/glutamyl-tRNA(Gln) amidotransferase subunit B
MFCGCSTAFGAAPNENVCPMHGDAGRAAGVESAGGRARGARGLAAHCEIARESIFDRKSYFYPDLPKGYQISQYDTPVCKGGYIEIALKSGETKRVRLTRIHLEEDAGKNIHEVDGSLVDLNRSGVPLVEIVSEPDMRTAEDAGAYLRELRMPCSATRSVRRADGRGRLCDATSTSRCAFAARPKYGVKTEIKNLNSFRFVEKAIEYEVGRQVDVIESGGKVDAGNASVGPGARGNAADALEGVRQRLSLFPRAGPAAAARPARSGSRGQVRDARAARARRARYISEFGLTPYEAGVSSTIAKSPTTSKRRCRASRIARPRLTG